VNDSLTYNSVVHDLSYKDKAESLRQSSARGINTPDRMYVRSQPYTDSVTKVPGTRYTVRFDRHDLDGNNAKIVSSAYAVFLVPETVTTAQYDVIVATFKAAIANADLVADVLNNEK
jgi:hypothetical protein